MVPAGVFLKRFKRWLLDECNFNPGITQEFYTGRRRAEVQTLKLLYTILDRKVKSFNIPSRESGTPFPYLQYKYCIILCSLVCWNILKDPIKYLNNSFPYPFVINSSTLKKRYPFGAEYLRIVYCREHSLPHFNCCLFCFVSYARWIISELGQFNKGQLNVPKKTNWILPEFKVDGLNPE